MPIQSNPFDYEPLTRSRRSRGWEAPENDWNLAGAEASAPEQVLVEQPKNPAGSKSAQKPTPPQRRKLGEPLKERILRRGHTVSFIFLFLFTAVVYFRPYELFPALSAFSSMAKLLAIVTIIIFLPTQLAIEGNLTTRTREVNLLLLLVLAALLSIPLALDPGAAWGSFIEYLKVVAMFIVLVNVVRTEKRLKALLLLVLAASAIVSIAAVRDYRIGNLALQGRRIEGVIGGLFSNPNDLALHLVTVVPLAVGLMLASRNFLSKIVYAICALVLVTGIVVTFSRGGFVALFSVVLFLMWRFARRSRFIFAILGLTLLIGLITVVPGAFRSRINRTDDASAIARIDDLKRSVYLTIRHPIFGVGIGNYVFYSNQMKVTHNGYTQVAAEMGLAAAAFYVLFLFAPLKRLRRIELETSDIRKKPKFYYMAIAIQASLIGYMVASFFASVAYLWYAYYLVGYAVCFRRIYGQVQENALKEAPALTST